MECSKRCSKRRRKIGSLPRNFINIMSDFSPPVRGYFRFDPPCPEDCACFQDDRRVGERSSCPVFGHVEGRPPPSPRTGSNSVNTMCGIHWIKNEQVVGTSSGLLQPTPASQRNAFLRWYQTPYRTSCLSKDPLYPHKYNRGRVKLSQMNTKC